MWAKEYTRATVADADAVWRLLADVASWSQWNDGIAALELDGAPAVGTVFRMTPPGEQQLTSSIVEFEPPRRLTDVTELDGISVRVEHVIEPQGTGSSITYRVIVSGAAPDEVLAEIGAGVSGDFPDVIAALAGRAEAL